MEAAIRRQVVTMAVTALVVGVGLMAPAAAGAAAPPLLTQFPPGGTPGAGAGQLSNPIGAATDGATGHLYVSEPANARISEFTALGEFVKAFGWDVSPEESAGDTAEDGLEVCTDTCKAGIAGENAGQFDSSRGLAVDDSGALYVVDQGNFRIQKFSSSGEFLLMFGRDVNKTNGEDVCTKVDLDEEETCGAGIEGIGPGQFGEEGGGRAGDDIDVGADGTIVVGDFNRIQKFTSDGTYIGEIPLPLERHVKALAVDQESGDVYVVLNQDFSVGAPLVPFFRLDIDTGAVVDELDVGDPDADPWPIEGYADQLAVDSEGNVYAVVRQRQTTTQGWLEVVVFDQGGTCLAELCPGDDFARSSDGTELWALATSDACGVPSDILYVTHLVGKSYVRAYGPPPSADCTPTLAPEIEDQYALSVGTDEASLRAEINPRLQADTTYYVEYGTSECASGGCQTYPAPPGSLLSGEAANVPIVTSKVFLPNLQPGTTYHYRFVARSGGGEVKGVGGEVGEDGEEGTFTTFPLPQSLSGQCPNQPFRTGPSAFLPDCRAYEMVSPVDKENGDIMVLRTINAYPAGLAQSSEDGEGLAYSSYRSFGDPESAPWTSQYIARRNPQGGWMSETVSPPREGASFSGTAAGLEVQYKLFSPDLCSGWLLQDAKPALSAAAIPGFATLYRRDTCGSVSYEAVSTIEPPIVAPNSPSASFKPELQGVSADGSRAVFRANGKLTNDASDEKDANDESIFQLYGSFEEKLRLLSVLPDGSASGLHSSAGTALGGSLNHREHSVWQAVSGDASRVYWTAAPSSAQDPGKIYVRENADQAQSALVNGDECTEPEKACTYPVSGAASGQFLAASAPDGSKALYAIGANLYEFDFESKSSTLVAGGVAGLVGASKDLARVYLVSSEDLAGDASAGEPNLYLREDETLTFVATLSGADTPVSLTLSPNAKRPAYRTSRVSPDGLHVAFMSRSKELSDLTASYDNTDAVNGEPNAEVYLYDAAAEGGAGSLVCISCNPSGARPEGRNLVLAGQPSGVWAAAQLPTWESQLYPERALADDGSRLFFESFEALVLRDNNGRQDVYQWEVEGGGSCDEADTDFNPVSGGCISLISSGDSPEDSEFVDASRSGSDVFFTTSSSLLSEDPGLVDIYDARVNGGFPPQPAPAAPCEGEACQSPPAPPTDATPASSAFQGPGNPAGKTRARRCPKGKSRVVRRGKARCVNKQQRQAKPAKRQHRRAAR